MAHSHFPSNNFSDQSFRCKLESERAQLISAWAIAVVQLNNRGSLILPQISKIQNASSRLDISTYLRQIHDFLGFKAKDEVSDRGHCAGALYRTRKFLMTENRSGAKYNQTIHIEHTVPVNILARELISRNDGDLSLTKWVFKHSVATAMNIKEPGMYLAGRHKYSNVFNSPSVDYMKPFRRYSRLFESEDNVVYNVLSGKEIDPDEFTFSHNLSNISKLLEICGLNRNLMGALESD